MSVDHFAIKACRSMRDGDPLGALNDICGSVEATCALVYGKGGRQNYKRFVHENLPFITHFAFGGVGCENINVPFSHRDVPQRPDGLCSVQEVIYHVVRCGLYHKADLPSNLRFGDEFECRLDGTLVLPKSLVAGLILAVVVNPVHAGMTTRSEVSLTIDQLCSLPIDKLWGRASELRHLWDALAPFR